jgi:hypothetical protein
MTIQTIPAGLMIVRQAWGQKRFDMRFQSGDSGGGQSRILAPPRWSTSISAQAELNAFNSALWRTLILSLDGQVNQLAVYDIINAAPQGTLRGALTLSAAANAGDTSISVTGGAPAAAKTLKAGDWLGIGAGLTRQLLSVAADVTFDGAGSASVPIKPSVRFAQASASAVVWDKPTALFRVTSDTNTWEARSINQGGYSLDLLESWE